MATTQFFPMPNNFDADAMNAWLMAAPPPPRVRSFSFYTDDDHPNQVGVYVWDNNAPAGQYVPLDLTPAQWTAIGQRGAQYVGTPKVPLSVQLAAAGDWLTARPILVKALQRLEGG
jgi:hypothetical protein